MRILGIDPGYAIVGIGVIEQNFNKIRPLMYKSIETEQSLDFSLRLATIYSELNAIIDRAKPHAAAVERLFFHTNKTTAIKVAEARGVILLSLELNKISLFEYTPLEIKQTLTGYGKAEKSQVMAMVQKELNLDKIPKPDDTADALAVALCHARTVGLRERLNRTIF